MLARQWIERQPIGTTFSLDQMYRYLFINFPEECTARGDASAEPQWKNDARWAIDDLLRAKIIKPVPRRRGSYQRVEPDV